MRTATHDSTTPTRLPVRERALVIPHILTPDELAALLRVGEALENISQRFSAIMGRPGGPLSSELRDLAEACVEMADAVEPDPDAEPDGSEEPSLGWTVDGRTGSGNDLHNLDAEEDIADGMVSLADVLSGRVCPDPRACLAGPERAA